MTIMTEKKYRSLTPRERLPLIFAATLRGDEAERDRLARSAPRVTWEMPDFIGLAEGMTDLTLLHPSTLLHLAVQFWRGSGLMAAQDRLGERQPRRRSRDAGTGKGAPTNQQLFGALQLAAHNYLANLEALRVLSTETHIDMEEGLRAFSAEWETLEETEDAALAVAFTPAEAAAWLVAEGVTFAPVTVANVVEAMREALRQRAERWV